MNLRKNHLRNLLLAVATLALPAQAGQIGRLSQAADLRSTPFTDAKTLRSLPQGTEVEMLKREGGWYRIKAAGSEGWVQMWRVRFSTPAGSGTEARDSVALIRSGRAGATQTTTTTGVRGLSEEELANAQPDPAALGKMEQLAVAPNDARAFAQQASLKAASGPKE